MAKLGMGRVVVNCVKRWNTWVQLVVVDHEVGVRGRKCERCMMFLIDISMFPSL